MQDGAVVFYFGLVFAQLTLDSARGVVQSSCHGSLVATHNLVVSHRRRSGHDACFSIWYAYELGIALAFSRRFLVLTVRPNEVVEFTRSRRLRRSQ